MGPYKSAEEHNPSHSCRLLAYKAVLHTMI